ncbi:MAG: hypothetical protein ABF539_07880 [Liquorilactobacillus nagelii]|uniref:hypothetical protein n=1 Tax=Liquorilactobacillus nagelii TaxID=82688 RepID=UPI0039E9468C
MSKESDYVKPPKKATTADDYVQPPKKQMVTDDYIKPPKPQTKAEEYVELPKKTTSTTDYADTSQVQTQIVNGLRSYFQTPKVKISFYLTGYLFLMCAIYLPLAWSKINDPIESHHLVAMINFGLIISYILLSNYTYSWFTDYQRYKNGSFSWFFTPYGSVKTGYASSAFMNYQTGYVSKGMFGNYKYKSRTGVGEKMLTFIIITLVVEMLKFMINIVIAFYSVFAHKKTIDKYQALVNERND